MPFFVPAQTVLHENDTTSCYIVMIIVYDVILQTGRVSVCVCVCVCVVCPRDCYLACERNMAIRWLRRVSVLSCRTAHQKSKVSDTRTGRQGTIWSDFVACVQTYALPWVSTTTIHIIFICYIFVLFFSSHVKLSLHSGRPGYKKMVHPVSLRFTWFGFLLRIGFSFSTPAARRRSSNLVSIIMI